MHVAPDHPASAAVVAQYASLPGVACISTKVHPSRIGLPAEALCSIAVSDRQIRRVASIGVFTRYGQVTSRVTRENVAREKGYAIYAQ